MKASFPVSLQAKPRETVGRKATDPLRTIGRTAGLPPSDHTRGNPGPESHGSVVITDSRAA